MKHPRLQTQAAEADTRAIGALVEELASGRLPRFTADFAWRGKPCSAADLELKLRALPGAEIRVLETRVVSAEATAEIGGLLESFAGMPASPGDRLAVVTLSFREHVISWGLLVDPGHALRAWFDPSALLQLIAP